TNYVFRWNGVVEHNHDEDDPAHDDEDHELLDEYEALEVSVTYIDRNYVVIQLAGDLQKGDRIVFNNAGRLLFAMQSGSSGHAHHDHAH
ncbi:MAG: hypothetical protein GY743_09205, partial [Planctomycetaceae bacterium]|nr:hypothetical protein [Planctomycetaceae bacterium]